MKRWLWGALTGLGVCLLLVLGRPEVGNGVDGHSYIAGWGRSVSAWREVAPVPPAAAPATKRAPCQAPPAVSASAALQLLLLTEPEVPPLRLGTRGPPGNTGEPSVASGLLARPVAQRQRGSVA